MIYLKKILFLLELLYNYLSVKWMIHRSKQYFEKLLGNLDFK